MDIHYGPDVIRVEIPPENLAFELRPRSYPAQTDVRESVRAALAAPTGSQRLGQLVSPGDKVVILADDYTRLTPTDIIIPPILDELNAAGVPDERIKVIVASGSHRAMTGEEKLCKYGDQVMRRVEVRDHDYLHQEHLLDYGVTERGTHIWVNREALQADVRISVGVIFPHFPAGWGGGAKIMLPGIAGDETTAQFHLLGVTDPDTQLGQVDTATRREMEEFAARVGLHFIVNVVLNEKGQVAGVFAGHFIQAHRAGVSFARQVFETPFPEKADLVLASTYPSDADYFQCMKGLYAADVVVRDGGEVVLISPMHEGMATTHREALEVAKMTIPQALAHFKAGDFEDNIGAAIMMYQIRLRERFGIAAISEHLTQTDADSLGVTLYSDPAALPRLVAKRIAQRPDIRIGVLHQATELLPSRRSAKGSRR